MRSAPRAGRRRKAIHPVSNKYFQIDGVATYVHHTGPTTLPEQPPRREHGEAIVCLHGEGGNGNVFAALMRELEASHTLIAFDQPGHGRSGQLDSLGAIDRMAAFTLAFCDKLGLDSVVLLGHAMGGAVGLRAALDRPGIVRALVVCSAGDGIDVPEATLTQAQRIRDGKERRAFDATAFSKNTSPDVMKQGFMEGLKTDPRATYGDLVACAEWDDTARLGEITAPTLVVHGDDDRSQVKARAERLVAAVPGAQHATIPSAGHSLPMEAPRGLGETVAQFLGGLS